MTSFRISLAVSAVMLIAPLVDAGTGLAGSPSAASADSNSGSRKIEPMPEERFWALIGLTAGHESDPEHQVAALHSALAKLPLDQIEAFEAAFSNAMRRSYSWELWGAAYVVNGGASDDGFEYFRRWLIAKGKKTFEQVSANPDSLADLVDPQVKGVLEFEAFAYVARRVWSENSGRPEGDLANAAATTYPLHPTGSPFEEDEAHLRARYPKLWRRFGAQPLQ